MSMAQRQVFLFGEADTAPLTSPDLQSYDHILVAFSGGKDSLACLLHLLDLGVPRTRIELWHHRIDGAEGTLMWRPPLSVMIPGSLESGRWS